MTATASKLAAQNGHQNTHSEKVSRSKSDDWQDVTGKFKIAFERMEKDQEENAKKVKRQTEALKKHASKSAAKK